MGRASRRTSHVERLASRFPRRASGPSLRDSRVELLVPRFFLERGAYRRAVHLSGIARRRSHRASGVRRGPRFARRAHEKYDAVRHLELVVGMFRYGV